MNSEGLSPPIDRIAALTNLPRPKSYKELRSRLGAINFYRRCLPGAAVSLAPLQKLVHDSQPIKGKLPEFKWTDEHTTAYNDLIKLLNKRVVLVHPPTSCNELSLTTDASDIAIGGVLEANKRPIGFYSRKLSPSEKRKSAFERELLALSSAVLYFRTFIESFPIIAFTDHKPLIGALGRKTEPKSRWQANRLAVIAEHIKEVRYLPGEDNLVADMLSRPPIEIDSVDPPIATDLPAIIRAQISDYTNNKEDYINLKVVEIGKERLYTLEGEAYP